MAGNNPRNYVDLLKNFPPDSNIDPKLTIPIITSLLVRVDSLENVLNERTQEIIDLKNNVFDLEKQVNFQERYSSKGCLIFSNFDINPYSPNLISDMCNLVYQYFDGCVLSPGAIKACHPLLTRKDSCENVPINLKFVYFSDKDEIFGRRRELSGLKGVQGKSLIIIERLPKSDMEIKRKCDNMNIITTTHNCQVKVFCQRPNGSFYSQNVTSFAGVEQLAKIAAKKQISQNRPRPHNYPQAVHKTFLTGGHTGAQLNTNSTPGISRRWSERNSSQEILDLDNQATKKLNIENESEALNIKKNRNRRRKQINSINLTEVLFFFGMERYVEERHMGDLKESSLYFSKIRSLRCHHD